MVIYVSAIYEIYGDERPDYIGTILERVKDIPFPMYIFCDENTFKRFNKPSILQL